MNPSEIKKIIEEFLSFMPVRVESVEVTQEEGRMPIFTVKTAESGILIGSHGSTFQAFSMILKKIVAAKAKTLGAEEPKFFVDVNDYRSGIANSLIVKANMLAERARSLRADIEMDPMNPYERLIVHEFLSTAPGVKTESRGEGKNRRIVIKFVENKTDDLDGI